MPEDVNREELARYLAGEASPEETERVRRWLAVHPRARLALEGTGDLPAGVAARRDPEAALVRLQAQMAPGLRRVQAPPLRPGATVYRLLRLAAVVAAVALTALLAYRLASGPADAPAYREVATARGERRTVTLADGSTVELNVESRLFVPEAFDARRRVVRLEGAAFFDVAPDAARPFVIEAGAAEVEVLGTAFGVDAYPEGADVAVVVVEGRVALRAGAHPGAGATLAPGDRGRLAGGPGGAGPPLVAVERVDPAAYLSWRQGRLVFQGAPLPDVARTLARWYDADVHVDAALAGRRLDAAFTGDEALPSVLQTIAAALEIDYRIEGRQVFFTRP